MPRPRSDLQPKIVRAARKRFLKEGVDGAGLRSIAREADTSIGMIYYYFPTKDDLFLAVVEEVYEQILAGISEALKGDVPVKQRIHRLSVYVSKLSREQIDVAKLIAREALVSSSRLERLAERFRRGHLALMLLTVVDGLEKGELDSKFNPVVLMMTAFAVSAMPHMARRLVGEGKPFLGVPKGEALADQLVDILFDGIGAKSARIVG